MFALLAQVSPQVSPQASQQLITPNMHAVLIHYPLGLLIAGVVIELLAFFWRRSSVRTAGRWMILIGALSLIPVTTSGLYALADATANTGLSGDQRAHMVRHIWFNSGATLVAAIVVVTWLGCADRWRAKFHLIFLALLVASCGLMVLGAWHGGEMVYSNGLEVRVAGSESVTHLVATTEPTTAAATTETAAGETIKEPANMLAQIEQKLPPIQTHVIFAGVTVALALAAMGLSIRHLGAGRRIVTNEDVGGMGEIATALESNPNDPYIADAIRPTTIDPMLEEPQAPSPPAARWWMLSALLAVLTAAAGVWFLATTSGSWKPNDLWIDVKGEARTLAHVIVGGAIVVLPLILALIARFAPRKKVLFTIFALLLVLAIAAQMWLGVLLMFDRSGSDSLVKFGGRK